MRLSHLLAFIVVLALGIPLAGAFAVGPTFAQEVKPAVQQVDQPQAETARSQEAAFPDAVANRPVPALTYRATSTAAAHPTPASAISNSAFGRTKAVVCRSA